ncbi:nucleoside hydrolase [Scytonema hofmannii FACHB-248]|uniref:Nucleoside hydrolase n=1 Tax=Scytonema hofmannii FACHB-248 TaxID=1842502 RepID=A0ABR8GY45_9CYAN|nr:MULTISPECIES: nucleoside hydrolase [Nostocales]MBD2608343.1 nucleoside hydrolase [Scytonema hofmannii FACHB-248]
MVNSIKPIPLIVDDDGSQDGMTALAFILNNPKFSVEAITISQGIALPPEGFINNLARMLGRLGDTDIPVGVGRPDPLSGNNTYPEFIRAGSDTFWAPFVTLPDTVPSIQTQSAASLIVETIRNSPEPVAILATGSLTNIAEALRLDPSIIDNIAVVQILGGAVFVPGNLGVLPEPPFATNAVAEFNIWVDPVAASEVFAAGERGLKIQLTPLDATNQISFDRGDLEAWRATGTPESVLSSEFLDFALTIIQSGNDPNPVWDLIAAINLSETDFSPETPLSITVDTESDPGATQGQLIVVPDQPPNILASLNPSFDNIPYSPSELFAVIAAQASVPGFSIGTSGDDVVYGSDARDVISGLSGDDIIYGNGGEDTLLGGYGNDTIYGSASNEFISGGVGNDTIYGNGGLDTIYAGEGDNLIYGGSQADRIFAGSGNDTIYANGGGDFINSGAGLDTVYLGTGKATVVLEAGQGYDTINNFELGSSTFIVGNLLNDLTFADESNGVRIFAGNDLLAVVSNQSASTFSSNVGGIFA